MAVARDDRVLALRFAVWMAAGNALLWSLFSLRLLPYVDITEPWWVALYAGLAWVGQIGLMTWLPGLILFVPLGAVFANHRLVIGVAAMVGTGGGLLMLLDTVVFDYYRSHLNGLILDLVLHGGTEIFAFSWVSYLVTALVGLLMLAVVLGWAWLMGTRRLRSLRTLWLMAGAGVLLTASMAASASHAIGDAVGFRPLTQLTRVMPCYRVMTAKRLLRGYGITQSATQSSTHLEGVARSLKTRDLRYPRNPLTCASPAKPKNVVLILIECWRFDLLSGDVTPNLSRFAQGPDTWRFLSHHSGGNATRLGVFSLFYGLYGTYWNAMYDGQRGPVLVEELRRQGYQLGLFASATLVAPPLHRTAFLGVPLPRLSSDGSTAWQRDQDVVADWRAWLANHRVDRPFFSFLFFDAPHAQVFPPDYPHLFSPMSPYPQRIGLGPATDPTPHVNRFKLAVHFVDSLVAEVLAELEHRGVAEETLVIVTGDHGEEFNDNGLNYWGHGGNYTRYQIQVPLLIRWPGRGYRRIDHRTTHLDLVPTLMGDLLGCDNPIADYSNGRHLLEAGGRDFFVAGGYFHFGIVEMDRITVSHSTGSYDIIDPRGRVLEDAALRPRVMGAALHEMSRFAD